MLSRSFIILCLFLISCSTGPSFSPVGKREFTKRIKFENPTLYTTLINNYLVYRSNMPEEAIAKHNTAIHTALMNPKNGVTYFWRHKNTKTWPDQEFEGILKIVLSSADNRGYCRTWLETIWRDKRFHNSSMTTACLNDDQTQYILADEIFYDQIN